MEKTESGQLNFRPTIKCTVYQKSRTPTRIDNFVGELITQRRALDWWVFDDNFIANFRACLPIKFFENPLKIDKVIDVYLLCYFLGHSIVTLANVSQILLTGCLCCAFVCCPRVCVWYNRSIVSELLSAELLAERRVLCNDGISHVCRPRDPRSRRVRHGSVTSMLCRRGRAT